MGKEITMYSMYFDPSRYKLIVIVRSKKDGHIVRQTSYADTYDARMDAKRLFDTATRSGLYDVTWEHDDGWVREEKK